MWFGCEDMPWESKVMRTSIVARGWSGWGEGDLDLGVWLGWVVVVVVVVVCFEDLRRCAEGRSLESVEVDLGVRSLFGGGEGVVMVFDTIWGAKACPSTRQTSSGRQTVSIPSRKRGSSMTKTSSRRRTPRVVALAMSSCARVWPRPSASPVDRQRILRWLPNWGLVRERRVGEKNMASSSGWAMRRIMRLLRRASGGDMVVDIMEEVVNQTVRRMTGAMASVTKRLEDILVDRSCGAVYARTARSNYGPGT